MWQSWIGSQRSCGFEVCILNHNIIVPIDLKHLPCNLCCYFCLQYPFHQFAQKTANLGLRKYSPRNRASFVGRISSHFIFKIFIQLNSALGRAHENR